MSIRVVGIDCATKPSKTGLALGEYSAAGGLEVKEARICSPREPPAEIVIDWLRHLQRPALLALDAPLGWPIALARALVSHQAGQLIEIEPHEMFRRSTDRFIKAKVEQKPLDVGADRIARTAHAALQLLAEVRGGLCIPIPLAWSPNGLTDVQAIEAYPAATLRAHGIKATRYKSPVQEAATNIRTGLVETLKSKMKVCDKSASAMEKYPDAFDAVV